MFSSFSFRSFVEQAFLCVWLAMVMRRSIGFGLVGDLETAVGAVVGAAAALLHLGRVLPLGGMVQVEDWDHVVLCRHTC